MAKQDREKWNARYLKHSGDHSPSQIVLKYHLLAPKGHALDIACGNGRNAIFLSQQGFQVDAVDISDVALNRLAGKERRINVICRDIDDWQIPQHKYRLILNIRFLDRRLFPMIKQGLQPGGVLIFESFIDEKKDYCLKPNELLHEFGSFHILYYEEKENPPSDTFDQSVSMVAVKR